MKNILIASACTLMLAGCGDSESPKQAGTNATAPSATLETVPTPSTADDKAIIKFADGTGIAFDGKIVRNVITENEKGKHQRYVIDLPAETMAVEGAVFNVMAKAGYIRRVRREEANLYAVNYVKENFPTIGAGYKPVSSKKANGMIKTRLILVWKI